MPITLSARKKNLMYIRLIPFTRNVPHITDRVSKGSMRTTLHAYSLYYRVFCWSNNFPDILSCTTFIFADVFLNNLLWLCWVFLTPCIRCFTPPCCCKTFGPHIISFVSETLQESYYLCPWKVGEKLLQINKTRKQDELQTLSGCT